MMRGRTIALPDRGKCCGCFACVSACKTGAISRQVDSAGFAYPRINLEKCVECRRCEKSCPIGKECRQPSFTECFAAKSNDAEIREKSSSGGIFTELALEVLRNKGCVFGCVLEKPRLIAVHVKAEQESDLVLMRGSKYVQSDVRDTFRECKQELECGRMVLYTGTPCMIAGLKMFLGKYYSNLITADLICHGVPAPAVFERYKAFVETKSSSRLIDIFFRSKIVSWVMFSMHLQFENSDKNYSQTLVDNPYMKAFLPNLCLRECCYSCEMREGRSGADITMADFWGISDVRNCDDDKKGVSALIVHSKLGRELLQSIEHRISLDRVSLSDIVHANPSYYKPAQRNPRRAIYLSGFGVNDFEKWVEYCNYGPKWYRNARRILFIIKQSVIRFIRMFR